MPLGTEVVLCAVTVPLGTEVVLCAVTVPLGTEVVLCAVTVHLINVLWLPADIFVFAPCQFYLIVGEIKDSSVVR